MSKRVATYARVSTEEQAKTGSSLESQREACAKYAEEQGWMVVAETEDAGVSGATFDRPGLDRVRDMAKAGQLDVLVVYDMDRLSRKALYHMMIEEELGKLDVSIHYVLGDYDDSHEGRFMKGIKRDLSEYERGKIVERLNRGKRTKSRNGIVSGGGNIAYGYRSDRNGHLVIEESEADVVRLIFRLFTNSEDVSISEIARRLTASPHETHSGKKKWFPCSVSNILKNETYSGSLFYNKVRKKNEYTEVRVPRPREEWIEIPVPPIVSRSVFRIAQKRLTRNRKFKRRQPRHPYLLSGMLVCAHCGYAYGGAYSGGHGYYRDGGEKHLSVRSDEVEKDVWAAVKRLLLNPSVLWAGHEQGEADVLDQKARLIARLDTLDKFKVKAEQKLEALTEERINPDVMMSQAEYIHCRQPILRDIAEREREIEEVKARLETEVITEVQVQAIEEFTDEVCRGIELLDFEGKRKVLRLLEIQGMVHREDGEAWIELEGELPLSQLSVSHNVFCHPFTY